MVPRPPSRPSGPGAPAASPSRARRPAGAAGEPSVLAVNPKAAGAAFLAIAAVAGLAWWDRVPVNPGVLGDFVARDWKLLRAAFPAVLGVWAGNLGHLALLAAIEAACALAGRRALRWALGRPGIGRIWELLFALGIGHGLAGCMMLGIGAAGLLFPAIVWLALVGGLGLAGDPRRWSWPAGGETTAEDASAGPPAAGGAVRAACAAVAVFCLAGLGVAFAMLMRSGPAGNQVFSRIPAAAAFPFLLASAAAVGVTAMWLRVMPPSASATAWALSGVCAFLAAANLIPAFQPEWFYDSLVYHLAVPEQYLIVHKIGYLGHTFISNYPFAQEMRFLGCLALGDDVLPKLMHWADGIAAAAAAWALARPFCGVAGAWLAAALFLSSPVLLFLQQVSMVELGLTWYAALAVMAAAASLRWVVPGGEARPRLAWLLLAGWFLGLAQGTKYVGLNLSLLVLGAIVLAPGRPGGAGRRFRDAAVVVGWASVWTGVWLAKNWAFTGNPLYPFFHGWLGGINWDETRQALWMRDNTKYGTGHGSFLNWLTMPAALSADAPGFGSISLNPFPLVFLPLLLLVRGLPPLIGFLGGFSALYSVLWATSAQEIRFLVPMLPMAAAAASFAVFRAGAGTGLLRAGLAASAGWVLLSSMHTAVAHRYESDVFTPYALGGLTRREMLHQVVKYYDAVEKANVAVPPGSRLLFVGSDESFYCARSRICDSIYDFSTLGGLALRARDPAALAGLLRRRRVTHVLVNERRAEEYLEYGLFDWPDPARRCLLGLWAGWFDPVFSARGVQLFELRRKPSPVPRSGRPSWLHEPALVRRSRELTARIDSLLLAGKTAEAFGPADELVKALPDAPQGWFYRGLVEAETNRMNEARRDDETAIRLGYPPAVTYLNLGVIYAMRGEYARALPVIEAAIPLDPAFADSARENALKVALILKRYDAALPLAEALLASRPADAGLKDQVVRLRELVKPPAR